MSLPYDRLVALQAAAFKLFNAYLREQIDLDILKLGEKPMSKKLSVLWVRGPSGHVLHRKREYTKGGGRTLCGIAVGKAWVHSTVGNMPKHWPRKCKRCAA